MSFYVSDFEKASGIKLPEEPAAASRRHYDQGAADALAYLASVIDRLPDEVLHKRSIWEFLIHFRADQLQGPGRR